MQLILRVGFLAAVLVGSVCAQTWEEQIEVAERLLASGYLDAAQADYEEILRTQDENSPAIDRAWYGIARVHMGKGEIELAKTSFEEVLKRRRDAAVMSQARDQYQKLKQQADFQVQQAAMAVQFQEYRYYSIPWYNILAKVFTWFDLRGARKVLDEAQGSIGNFDPHFLIDTGIQATVAASGTLDAPASGTTNAGSVGVSSGTVHSGPDATATNLLPPPPTSGTSASLPVDIPTAAQVVESRVAPPLTAVETAAPVPPGNETATASRTNDGAEEASADLGQLQQAYRDAYKGLQNAMTSNDQKRIQEANGAYQDALRRYRDEAFE